MWKCPVCGAATDNERPDCSNCGMVRIGPGTNEKYAILRGYLPPLSLIMRNQGYEHYFIDACAGSGTVFDSEKKTLVEGSPMIMARTREAVQNMIRDKTKPHEVQCVGIEGDHKTFGHLKQSLGPFSGFATPIMGDCNDKLDQVLDGISSEVKAENHFAFVYIDPFGFGKPTIQRKTIERVFQRKFTELLIHFTWEGVSRLAGYSMKVDDPDSTVAKTARSYVQVLDVYLGVGWRAIEEKKLSPVRRRTEYVQLYFSRLQQHYPHSMYTEIPVGSQNPNYYLFFATRNLRGYEIMKRVVEKVRLKGSESLEKFSEPNGHPKPPSSDQPSLDKFWN